MSTIKHLRIEYLGCDWFVEVSIEPDDDVTPGSVTIESIEGFIADTPLPSDLEDYHYEEVAKRAIEKVSHV